MIDLAGRPRQRDIAARARVSQTTVSLVLNGKSEQYGITAETERRIRKAIAELGYVPSVTAQALRGGRNGLIGVHTFEPMFPTGADHYYYEFMVGIEQQATAAGQDLVMITSVHQAGAGQSIYREGTNRLRIADGAVILGFQEHDEELEELARQQFPFVFIGRRQRAAELMPYVVPDYVDGVRKMVQLIAELGHRRVAYLAGRAEMLPREQRFAGFRDGQAATGIELVAHLRREADEITAELINDLLRRSVTVMIVDSYPLAERIGTLCAAERIDIPDGLSVVSLDSLGYGSSRDWTHLESPRRDLGSRAVEILIELMNGEVARSYHELLPCPVRPGSTLLRR
ncbi:LacI family transcriptional regulator [Microlunatus elymi]|uniref:LacI family transcriptional regulator n=1 Tax=Microlunatus elymi TaxID=2596828 RepID=A0A516PY85_9ACTN|nr:LacI family DNA-binding transcriptional regulator [Microlunatus elymi]QDP96136.1 LacI family transcriptional regulator [Microlunatus elymi]